jgi:alpha-1,3-mannosyltransferase
MIIAHVVRQYYPSVGGFEEVVRNLAKHQLAQGHQPYIITLNRYFKALDQELPERELIDNIPVIRIPFKGSTRYPIAFSVLKHLNRADIVHIHAIDFFYDFLAITKFIHKKKLIATTHGGFFHTGFASTLKKIYFQTFTRFSGFFYEKVIASSENDGEIFKSIIPLKKLNTIENGVDVEKLKVESKTGFPPALLYFGRWSENKGIFDALELFAKLVKQDTATPWRFFIAGLPYDINEAQIKNKIDGLGLSKSVEIYQNLDTAKLKALTLKATYFISLSKFEGFGIAPIEAMSAGLYPILSNIPPFMKLVNSTQQGLIVEAINETNITKIIQHYHAQNFSAKKLQESVQKFTWVDVAKKYLNSYDLK